MKVNRGEVEGRAESKKQKKKWGYGTRRIFWNR